jgi:hypothetical protein
VNRTSLRHIRVAAVASALLVACGGTVALATGGASTGPVASAAKVDKKRVGLYRGTTELGRTVSFRITKKRKVVGFTISKMEVTCTIVGPDPPLYNKPPFTLKAPTMKLEGVARFKYQNPLDESGPSHWLRVDGKIDGGAGGGSHPPGYVNTHMKGNAEMLWWNGPMRQDGTEVCGTEGDDWEAKKVGK